MDTQEFLIGQLGSSSEAWQRDHKEAMQCVNVELIIDDGLRLFEMGRRGDVEWTRSVKAGQPFDVAEARKIIGFYKWWLKPAPAHIRRMEEFIAKGYKFARKKELLEAIEIATAAASLSPEGLEESLQQRKTGKTRSFKEVMNASRV